MEGHWLHTNGRTLIAIGIIIIATIVIAVVFRKIGDRLIKRLSQREDFDPTNFRFLQHIITAVLVIVGIAMVIFMIPSMKHVAKTLLTGAGILAVVVGFASQAALSNIISGVFIVIFKPYRINDIVTIRDTMSGVIEDISLRHTVIRNYENRRIVIPNSVISNEVIVNANYEDDKVCKWIEWGISYTADIDHARRVVQEIVEAHPNFLDHRTPEEIANGEPKVRVKVLRLGQYSIDMRAWAWAETSAKGFNLNADCLEEIKKRFDREGIEIPYPYQNLIIKDLNSKQEK
ncbi:mechanosensitive ion channel family protein [Owenweeksia hongkongensis]|uniref:mechanosensitive ion channel family protein n=1 Tax=Owenweeksia hongkongensis TaxID=253245 RepID=UPI003A951D13